LKRRSLRLFWRASPQQEEQQDEYTDMGSVSGRKNQKIL